jgi:hypothetical protein
LKQTEILTVPEAAKRKGVSRQTIYNNRGAFDWNSGRIIANKRFNNWQPGKKLKDN